MLQFYLTSNKKKIISFQEVGSASHIGLQFLDEVSGEESSWDLHVASPVAACHIIQAIRTPWSHLFSVDLQVTYHTSSNLVS